MSRGRPGPIGKWMIASFGGDVLPSQLEQPVPIFIIFLSLSASFSLSSGTKHSAAARAPSWQVHHKTSLQSLWRSGLATARRGCLWALGMPREMPLCSLGWVQHLGLGLGWAPLVLPQRPPLTSPLCSEPEARLTRPMPQRWTALLPSPLISDLFPMSGPPLPLWLMEHRAGHPGWA